jgi:hypothetical protein
MTLSGHTGTVVNWEKQLDMGGYSIIVNNLTTYSEIPSAVGTWDYRVVVQSGICPAAYSSVRSIVVLPALPVTLVDFTASKFQQRVLLTWHTASELNNEKFIVERSADGKSFKTLGEMAGHGTTQTPEFYSFVDEKPLSGINYYRLRQMDFDGQFKYSPVRSVAFRNEGGISIYPTVVGQALYLQLPDTAAPETKLTVFSVQGSLVYQQVLEGTGILTIALPQMAAGQYVVEAVNGGFAQRSLVFKQ